MNDYVDPPTPPRGTPPPPPPRHYLHDTGPHTRPAWQERQAPRPAPRNGLGIAALVTAALGVLAGIIPLLWLPAAALAVLGFALGGAALGRVNRGEATNSKTAKAAIITSLAAAALSVLGAVLFFSAAEQLATDLDELSAGPPPVITAPTVENYGPGPSLDEEFGELPPMGSTPTVEESGITDGTWLVGEDIEPGTYRTGGPQSAGAFGNCYHARLSGTSGELDDIISNDNSQGPTVITIRESDVAFETNGCQPWEPR